MSTLRDVRRRLGLSQARLAAHVGVSQQTISKLEAGRIQAPSYVLVVRLVAALRQAGLRRLTAHSLFPTLPMSP